MNWDRVQGNWKQFKGKVKERWGKITDDQLDVIGGKREQLAGRVQEVYGLSKDEAEQQISAFEDSHRDWTPEGEQRETSARPASNQSQPGKRRP